MVAIAFGCDAAPNAGSLAVENVLIGLVLAFLGGAIQGTFFFPMKFMRQWRWENGWLVWTMVCCLILPLGLAWLTTPDLWAIYSGVGLKTVGLVFLFGLGWGAGAVLYGLGAEFLGMALGIAIITAINACLGTLLPILFLREEQLTRAGMLVLAAGLAVLVLGVVLVSIAGSIRAARQKSDASPTERPKTPFLVGLVVCILAGVLCPSANFAFFFGKPITDAVNQLGTVAVYNSGYALLLPWFLGGWVVNTVYCLYLMARNDSLGRYREPGSPGNMVKGVVMSVLFLAGMVLYGSLALNIIPGRIGPVVGWPVFLAATIITANLLGVLSGEWRGSGGRALAWLYGGIALLIVASALTGVSNIYKPEPSPGANASNATLTLSQEIARSL
jgi:L-rhamnose-H+ transport protein